MLFKQHGQKRKQILLIDLGGSMAGVEKYLLELVEILHPSANVFALCALEELAQKLESCGVKVFKIPTFQHFRLLRFVTAFLVLPVLILRHRIAIVQVNGFLESILLIPARLLGCTTIYTRHGPFETDIFKWYKQPAKFVPRILSRYCAHFASRLVCVSETVAAMIGPSFPAEQVIVIPNWVSRVPDYKPRTLSGDRRVQVVYVGRLEKYKGLHLLLEAIREIGNVKLSVVGDGGYRQSLEQLGSGLDVEFVGFQSDPTPYFEMADIFVMPSMGPEGLPLVALEAMSHALPCLFSDLPVHSEITESGRAAMLFRSGDVKDLRDRLRTLIDDSSERTRYAEYAYQRIKSNYHVSGARRAYLQLFGVEA